MFVSIRSAAFVIVVTQKLVLQQSKNVTAKCKETLSPPPSIQYLLGSNEIHSSCVFFIVSLYEVIFVRQLTTRKFVIFDRFDVVSPASQQVVKIGYFRTEIQFNNAVPCDIS